MKGFIENKQNLNFDNNTKRFRTFGQEIKARMKLVDTPLNVKQVNRMKDNPGGCSANVTPRHMPTLNFQKLQVSKSGKNVKFAQKLTEACNIKRSSSSILKNKPLQFKGNQTTRSQYSERNSVQNSLKSSMVSSYQQEEQSCQNQNTNKVLKEKYERLLNALKKGERKYTDELFCPVSRSLDIASSLQPTSTRYPEVRWMRITELFRGKQITVWSSHPTRKNTILFNKAIPGAEHLATVFNTIKHCNVVLQKVFESQQINQHGIYILRINHNNCWRYTIIDDNIPVIKSKGIYTPAFISTIGAKETQIWPYLLLKAYAKQYSCYHNLFNGNQVQLLEELTMNRCTFISLQRQHQLNQIIKTTNQFDSVLMAKDLKGKIHPLTIQTSFEKEQPSHCFIWQDKQNYYNKTKININQFHAAFTEISKINVHNYYYSFHSLIRTEKNSDDMSLRSFKIQDPTQAQITIIQKDKKLYPLSMKYSYSWTRIIVAMKENNSYKWIDGVYGNTKSVSVKCNLEVGEYFVIVMPQWSNGKHFDLSLVYQGNSFTKIQKLLIKAYPNILTQVCMDLAQTKGKLNQINSTICSYNYIHYPLGFIIQNINNERQSGDVKIQRSIQGLRGKFPIQAVNKQFKGRNIIQVTIEKFQHFTVVLKLIGGIDPSILQLFDFGS